MKATPKTKAKAKSAAKPAKPAAKKPAASASKPVGKKAVKPVAKAPAQKVAKPVAKAPAKKAIKPVAKAPAKKGVASKPVKPVAKKAAKPVPKKAAQPAAKVAVKKATPASSKPTPKKTVTAAPAAVTKKPVTLAKPVAVAPAPAPVVADATRKFTGRAAKAAAGVPPPPSAVPFSNPAKASFGPASESLMPALVPVIPKKDAKLANNWKTKTADQLTDAEVIAMPDSEYMNDTQMAFFRLKLQQLKQDILASAGETTEHLREDTVIVPDPADRATIEEEHALELRTRDRERKLLKKIEQSIQRIDLGDYGYCDETGEPIGVPRLLARPTATLSLEAQQRRELKQKMFGD